MLAGFPRSRLQRRGIILVVVLGMLGILALIGVTFATFSGQAQVGARNFALSQVFPDSTEMMDYGLSQLIDDTGNPLSALRGHSLKRDMYGNDAGNNGYLAGTVDPTNNLAPTFLKITGVTYNNNGGVGLDTLTVATNIPTKYTYGLDFTRWVLKVGSFDNRPTNYIVGETLEVITDNAPAGGYHTLTTTVPDKFTGYANPDPLLPKSYGVSLNVVDPKNSIDTLTGRQFLLDGRFLRAFNGPGMSTFAPFANFRFNGPLQNIALNQTSPQYNIGFLGDPNAAGMDEDYDACDLENWFLAIQSADGQVMIPSFHRPNVLVRDPNTAHGPYSGWDDWTDFPLANISTFSAAQLQLALATWSKCLRPRAIDHNNNTTSFPDLKPDATGTMNYDVDNDGDGIADSVWLDLGYPPKRDATGRIYKPLFAFMVIGLNGRMPLNTVGNLQLRNAAGVPQYDHASHLGTSPSEINPKYALHNAANGTPTPITINGNSYTVPLYSQFDDAGGVGTQSNTPGNGVSVALTQLRNILTGTRPQNNLTKLDGQNQDSNSVIVNGVQWFLPNNVADSVDYSNSGVMPGNPLYRNTGSVSGRWGEVDAVPTVIFPDSMGNPVFRSPVGPGLSYLSSQTYPDIRDDDFDAFDHFPSPQNGEQADYYDPAGALGLPSERYRRFVTPIDLQGDGLVSQYNSPSTQALGPDNFGRVSFYKYFRPAGVPVATVNLPGALGQTKYYTTTYNGSYSSTNVKTTAGSPGAINVTTGNPLVVDLTSNRYHNYEFVRNPLTPIGVPVPFLVGAMPWDNSQTAFPTYTPQINSNYPSPSPPPPFQPLPGLNRADEMQLYSAAPYDAAFGPGDLEWLYRQQDSDGSGLYSRLAQLAPISFGNPADGLRRCRLFCTDTWETTNFAWTGDNPSGTFSNNARFGQFQNASNQQLGNGTPAYLPNGMSNPPNPGYTVNNSGLSSAQTPEVALRDRKINLNFPLPVSNDPFEPVRHKWIRESYQLLKCVLPPRAVDTPQELAQLSQFLINVVDFRDPDCAVTIYANPDVQVAPPVAAGSPPTYYLNATTVPGLSATLYAPGATKTSNLVQYGMEYNPVAINEVLAYWFPRKDTSFSWTAPAGSTDPSLPAGTKLDGTKNPIPTPRFFIELVNTLTQSAQGVGTDPSYLDLSGWDMVISHDDPSNRPDPITGQNPDPTASTFYTLYGYNATNNTGIPLNTPLDPANYPGVSQSFIPPATSAGPMTPLVLAPIGSGTAAVPPQTQATTYTNASPQSATSPGPGSSAAFNYYFVFGNKVPDPSISPPPLPTNQPTYFETNFPDPTGSVALGKAPDSSTNNPPQQVLTFVPNPNDPKSKNPNGGTLDDTDPLDYQNTVYKPVPLPNYPAGTTGHGEYYWVYIRRPANPFDPMSPKVVVDCMRFPYLETNINVTTLDLKDSSGSAGPKNIVTSSANYDNVSKKAINLDTFGPAGGGETGGTQADNNPPGMSFKLPSVSKNDIYSIQRMQPFRGGHAVPDPTGTNVIPSYGYSEQTCNLSALLPSGNTPMFGGWPLLSKPPGKDTGTTASPPSNAPSAGIYHTLGQANAAIDSEWDYLPFHDRDFQSVAELLLVPGCPPGLFTKQFVEFMPSVGTFPASPKPGNATPPTTVAALSNAGQDFGNTFGATGPPRQPHTYPYLVDHFFYSGASSTPDATTSGVIGGPSGAGWHKMLDCFEVPSPAFGAIGPVAQGNNFDWARQDLRPGMLNLNLIVDDEVFLGLMDDGTGNPIIPLDTSAVTPANKLPIVVTQIDANGNPSFDPLSNVTPFPYPTYRGYYSMSNVGANGSLSQAFADFLVLAHGGGGLVNNTNVTPNIRGGGAVFGSGLNPTNAAIDFANNKPLTDPTNPAYNPLAGTTNSMPHPFRSLSFPDINYTVMRPAPMQQSPAADPGVKNVVSTYTYNPSNASPVSPSPILPEPIPTRRLFQMADAYAGGGGTNASNASLTGDAAVFTTPTNTYLSNTNYNLTKANLGAPDLNMLGGAPAASGVDRRQSPYFRTEWLQRVMNLATVRTHQYAVWITVGFFEVSRQGDPQLANINPSLAYDILGTELNATSGRNIRYRSFFILDRTRAAGFNANLPGDFRDVVVYRQSIE